MSEDLHDIDDLFRKGLGDNSEVPPDKVWDNIDKGLDKKKVISISKKYSKLKWAVAVLLLFSISMAMYGVYINRQNKDLVKQRNQKSNIQQIKIIPEAGDQQSSTLSENNTKPKSNGNDKLIGGDSDDKAGSAFTSIDTIAATDNKQAATGNSESVNNKEKQEQKTKLNIKTQISSAIAADIKPGISTGKNIPGKLRASKTRGNLKMDIVANEIPVVNRSDMPGIQSTHKSKIAEQQTQLNPQTNAVTAISNIEILKNNFPREQVNISVNKLSETTTHIASIKKLYKLANLKSKSLKDRNNAVKSKGNSMV